MANLIDDFNQQQTALPATATPAPTGNLIDDYAHAQTVKAAVSKAPQRTRAGHVPGTQYPPDARANPLRTAGEYLDVPTAYIDAAYGPALARRSLAEKLALSAAGPFGPLFAAIGSPEYAQINKDLRAGGPGYVAENDVMFRKGFMQRVLADPNADPALKAQARYFMEHPYQAGAMNFIQTALTPGNVLLGEGFGVAGRVASKVPALGDVIGATGHVADRFVEPFAQAAGAVTRPLARAAGAAGIAALKTTAPGRAFVDRYFASGLPQRGGPKFVHAALAADAAPTHAAAQEVNFSRQQWNDLTPDQKLDLQRRLTNPDFTPRSEPAKGPTIEQRAQALSERRAMWEEEQVRYKLLQEQVATRGKQHPGPNAPARMKYGNKFDTETFFPMNNYGQPIFKSDARTVAAKGPKEYGIGPPPGPTGVRRPGFSSNFARGKGKSVDINDPDAFADLHPNYDPAYQWEQHYSKVAASVASEKAKLGLERLVSVDPQTGEVRNVNYPGFGEQPMTARMPLYYAVIRPNGEHSIFGFGEEGFKNAQRYVRRLARTATSKAARLDPRVVAAAQKAGISPQAIGTRVAPKFSLGAAKTRLREAKSVQKAALQGAQGPLQRVIKAAQRSGQDVVRASQALGERLQSNLGAARTATASARAAKESSDLYREDIATLDRLTTAGASDPTKKTITALARQMRDAEQQQWGPVTSVVGPKSITPDWVYEDGRWHVAGEFDDVPARYLDLSNRPKRPPFQTQGLRAVENGNIDDVASQAGMDSDRLREWMTAHPKPPTIGDYLDRAEKQLADEIRQGNTAAIAETMERAGVSGTPKQALAQLKKTVDSLKREAAASTKEAQSRTFAERELGPTARATVAAGERTGKTLDQISQEAQSTFARVQASTQKRLAAAATDAQRKAAIREANEVYQRSYRDLFTSINDNIQRNYEDMLRGSVPSEVKPTEFGGKKQVPLYRREADLAGSSPTGSHMALDDSFYHFFENSAKLPAPQSAEAQKFWRTMQAMNRLARLSIVLIPTVHGINNMGMAYLSEGGDLRSMGEILATRKQFAQALKDRAYAAGAAQDVSPMMWSADQGAHATTATADRAQMAVDAAKKRFGPLGEAVRGDVTGGLRLEQGYNALNRWLFKDVEQGYAFDLFDRFTKAGMSDGAAAMRVRQALGRYENISPIENWAHLRQLFYFYPWMKTVIPFWIKKGMLDPKWWSAPVAGIRTLNELQGFDDPSKPFTGTFGKRDANDWRRITLPVPQRVLENVAELGRAPLDFLRMNPAEAGEDLKAPVNYVAGHFNPAIQIGTDLIKMASGGGPTRVPPYNTFAVNTHLTGAQNMAAIGARTFGKLFAPASRLESLTQDPAWSMAAFLAGSFIYPHDTQRGISFKRYLGQEVGRVFGKAITAAKATGDEDLVNRLTDMRAQVYQKANALHEQGPITQPATAPAPLALPAAAPTAAPSGNLIDDYSPP